MQQVRKLFSQFSFREYLAWTSEDEGDEFIELDQFAGEIYNKGLPWDAGIEAILEYIRQRSAVYGDDKEDMLMELYDEYQEMVKHPDEDEMYIIEMDDDHIISVYTMED